MSYLLGLFAVVLFALTLPATRVAVHELDPVFVGAGRAVCAALLAALYLLLARQRLPSRDEVKRLALVSAGCVIGFPMLIAWAMQRVDASHGGVVLGVLPLATAIAGAYFSGERPSRPFWAYAVLGAAIVVVYSALEAKGIPQLADLALLAAIVCAGIGYAEGARLTKTLGGLQVMSWALILGFPVLVIPALASIPTAAVSLQSWTGFAYVALISQFLGFVPWYRGMALGGIAKVSQTQLLQPFLTVLASGFLLDEPGSPLTWAVALLVVAVVALTRASSAGTAIPGLHAAKARPG